MRELSVVLQQDRPEIVTTRVTLRAFNALLEVSKHLSDGALVESEKVGSVTRSGVVTAIDGRLITGRWDTGSESVFVPSAGSLQVTGHESAVRKADSS